MKCIDKPILLYTTLCKTDGTHNRKKNKQKLMKKEMNEKENLIKEEKKHDLLNFFTDSSFSLA